MIRIILISSLVVITGYITLGRSSNGIRASRKLAFLCFLVSGIMAVLFPEKFTALANLLGVGRGADLLLYFLTVIFLGSTVTTYLSFSQMRRREAELVKTLALIEVSLAEHLRGCTEITRADSPHVRSLGK